MKAIHEGGLESAMGAFWRFGREMRLTLEAASHVLFAGVRPALTRDTA